MSNASKAVESPRPEPANQLVIRDLETLKVLTDPLRLQILELMSKPITVKVVARSLAMPPTKLYYHVGQMEAHGLIRVVGTRVVSGIIEKQYQVTAKNYSIDRSLLEIHKKDHSSLTEILHNVMDGVSADIQKGLESGLIQVGDEHPVHQRLVLGRTLVLMTPQQAQQFIETIHMLLKQFSTGPSEKAQPYSFLIAFHPHSQAQVEEGDND
ncbi:helix-turn-helix domain-containing protein [uncultured Meiothermus sp.]|uniref:winged helix-turn-helix domain-containing protein n=1 Tax=uncultured Meiothermus sp. TaxID=157471 RepID=UPI00260AC66C|nr:helix-turn-helix domain-containing protein [uncultured Meiothermus sp.]